MAHRGVLFVDEAPECTAGVLDSLRQPLETGVVMISRAAGSALYPASFMLVLAANPCPCGRFTTRAGCSCTPNTVRRYLSKLSGPLLDRIDLQLAVSPISRVEFAEAEPAEKSSSMRERVMSARERAEFRWGSGPKNPAELRRDFPIEQRAQSWLHSQVDSARLTARGVNKVMRLAWTICDLRGGAQPNCDDVQEAVTLRRSASVVLDQ